MIILQLCALVCVLGCIGGSSDQEKREEVAEKVAKENDKPNIIFILVDDVGWADFDYNTPGSSAIPTPHIDSLAGQG